MQHDMMRHPAPPSGADNVGDVLASIRRLIAQDEAGCRIPNQALNTLPAQDIAPRIRVEPTTVAAAVAVPLVLDSTDMVAKAAPQAEATTPVAEASAAEPVARPVTDEPVAKAAELRVGAFGDWLKQPLPQPDQPDQPAVAETPQPTRTPTDPEIEAAAEAEPPVADSGFGPDPARSFGFFFEHPTTPNVQMEETMLHANSTVTQLNPLAEAHAAAEALNRETEQHLFAPQDKDTQKGTHLRGMIREAIRQELQGEIGNRLSRNLQQMIRHEIELTLRQMCEQE